MIDRHSFWTDQASQKQYITALTLLSQPNLTLIEAEEAFFYLDYACLKNNTSAINFFREKLKDYTEYARNGSANANYLLGICYAKGYGLELMTHKDFPYYREYFFKICEKRILKLYKHEALKLYDGAPLASYDKHKFNEDEFFKTYKDDFFKFCKTKAFKYYQEAARCDPQHMYAFTKIAECYYYGSGTTRNRQAAENYFRLAAEKGDKDADLMLRALALTNDQITNSLSTTSIHRM